MVNDCYDVTPPSSGFGSAHHPNTSLASGQGLHGAGRCSASFERTPQRCLCPITKPWLFRGKVKRGFYTFHWGYLLKADILPHIWAWRSRLWPEIREWFVPNLSCCFLCLWLMGFMSVPNITNLFRSQDASVMGTCFGLCVTFCLHSLARGGGALFTGKIPQEFFQGEEGRPGREHPFAIPPDSTASWTKDGGCCRVGTVRGKPLDLGLGGGDSPGVPWRGACGT